MKSKLLQAALVVTTIVGMAAPALADRDHDHYRHYHHPYYRDRGYVYAPPPVVYAPPPPPPVAGPSLNLFIPLHIR